MILSPTLFDKMTITCTEETEDGMTITFDWDDTDPVFEPWNQMPEHEKRSFILTSISNQLQGDLDVAS
jgi:hypothetical protein